MDILAKKTFVDSQVKQDFSTFNITLKAECAKDMFG